MPGTATAKATRQLTSFYGEMTSLDRVRRSLERDGVDVEHLQARDLYERDLDCQNLGAFTMLEVIAAAVAERAAPNPTITCSTSAAGWAARAASSPTATAAR